MTTIKKKIYVKPQITVIEVDAQQLICASLGDPEDGCPLNNNEWNGEYV